MRQGFLVALMLLLAGCSATPPPAPSMPREGEVTDVTLEALLPTPSPSPGLFLRDPDVIGIRAPGLRVLNVTANATFRLSNALVSGTPNVLRWVAILPTAALDNSTTDCGAWDPAWRMRHFLSGVDTLTNQPIPAGNWSIVVHSEKLTNLTLLFNTTLLASYRLDNGSALPWRVQVVDADPRIESNNSPYRVTFNKTFATRNRTWVIGQFGVRGDGFTQFREIRSKIEGSDGFLCGEHRNDVPQPVIGGTTVSSVLGARLGNGGTFSYAGRFEATAVLNARPVARAEVVFLD